MNKDGYVLLIDEVEGHPKSLIKRLSAGFETHSIIHVASEQRLLQIKTKPIFSDKYLVIFDTFYALKQSLSSIRYDTMFPVYKMQFKEKEDILLLFKEKDIPYHIVSNPFSDEDARYMLCTNANAELSEYKQKLILKKTRLSPVRILTAISILNSSGYTVNNINELLVFPSYVSAFDIILMLLHQNLGLRKSKTILTYLSEYRHAFQFIQSDILEELDLILQVFDDLLEAVPEKIGVLNYIENTNKLSSGKYHRIYELYQKVSIIDLLSLKRFIEGADLLSFLVVLGG